MSFTLTFSQIHAIFLKGEKMNIFVLDLNPKKAAVYHHNAHVVKMILESAQLLSTSHRFLDGEEKTILKNSRRKKVYRLKDKREEKLYQATHINHPCSVWVRESSANYNWLFELFLALNDGYTRRYGKIHKCKSLEHTLKNTPNNIKKGDLTSFALAMPDECKTNDPVESYRNYYKMEKLYRKNGKKNEWFTREIPFFMEIN